MWRAATAVAAAALAVFPAGAVAHASLTGGTPEPGGVAAVAPRAVELRFDEAVDPKLATIRVEDDHGRRWDAGRASGGGKTVQVALRAGAPHGRYAVLYRVVSDDGHTIPGGFGFAIGREVTPPPARLDVGAGAVGGTTGLGTATAIARATRDAGLTIALGALLFALLVWPRALAEAVSADELWRAASRAFDRALRRTVVRAAGLGAAASASLLLLSAEPSGLSPTTLTAVLSTRFGHFTALCGLVLAALAGGTAWASRHVRSAATSDDAAGRASTLRASDGVAGGEVRESSSLRVAQLGATGLAPVLPSRARVAVVAAAALALALLPVLAGHATTRAHPVLLTASGTVHVFAAATWVGGLAALLFALTPALRALRAPDRKTLLAAVLRRFSTVALLAVGALAVTGIIQAVVEVGSLDALRDAAFGRAVVIKAGLLLMVAGVASAHHAAQSEHATQRTLRTEALLVVALLATTGVLAGSAPPGGALPGPPQLRLAYEQATARGTYDDEKLIFALARPNGLAFTELERLDVVARGPGGRRAQASATARPDGAYAIPLTLRPSGRWRVTLTLRVDTYNSYTRTTEVSVP